MPQWQAEYFGDGVTIKAPSSLGTNGQAMLSGGDGTTSWGSAGGGMAIGDAVTGATATRILFVGAGPVLADDANLTWDGSQLVVTGLAGINEASPGAQLHVTIGDAARVGQIIELAATPTANAFEINTNGGSGGDLTRVSSSGMLTVQNSLDVYQTSSHTYINAPAHHLRIGVTGNGGYGTRIYATGNGGFVEFLATIQHRFMIQNNKSSGDFIEFGTTASSGNRLISSATEQSWLRGRVRVNQSGTAAYNGLLIDVTEVAIGDGSSGDGNNFIRCTIGDVTKHKVGNDGGGYFATNTSIGTTSFGAGADKVLTFGNGVAPGANGGTASIVALVDELWAYDGGAIGSQLTSHPIEVLETSDEPFPFGFKSESAYLGKRIVVEWTAALRALEALTSQTFVTLTDIPKRDWDVDTQENYDAEVERRIKAEMKIEVVEPDVSVAFELVDETEEVDETVEVPETEAIEEIETTEEVTETIDEVVPLEDAFESVEIMEDVETEVDVFELDPKTKKTKKVKRKKTDRRPTGKFKDKLKEGHQFDETTGQVIKQVERKTTRPVIQKRLKEGYRVEDGKPVRIVTELEERHEFDPDTQSVTLVQTPVPKRVKKLTGKKEARPKDGYRFDEQTGKAYRKKTREEALVAITLPEKQKMPAWLKKRLTENNRGNNTR